MFCLTWQPPHFLLHSKIPGQVTPTVSVLLVLPSNRDKCKGLFQEGNQPLKVAPRVDELPAHCWQNEYFIASILNKGKSQIFSNGCAGHWEILRGEFSRQRRCVCHRASASTHTVQLHTEPHAENKRKKWNKPELSLTEGLNCPPALIINSLNQKSDRQIAELRPARAHSNRLDTCNGFPSSGGSEIKDNSPPRSDLRGFCR